MFTSYNKETISKTQDSFALKYNDIYKASFVLNGLDWNYAIAPYLDRDLHEKLLEVTQTEMAPIIETVTMILSLIRSGYFYTASVILNRLDVSKSSKLIEIKAWLLKSLLEADDTEEV
jgi:hypothetical protein